MSTQYSGYLELISKTLLQRSPQKVCLHCPQQTSSVLKIVIVSYFQMVDMMFLVFFFFKLHSSLCFWLHVTLPYDCIFFLFFLYVFHVSIHKALTDSGQHQG